MSVARQETVLPRDDVASSSEAPIPTRNSFVEFVQQNATTLEEFSDLTHELREVDRAWRNSTETEQLIGEHLDIVDAVGIRIALAQPTVFSTLSTREKSRQFDQWRSKVRSVLFDKKRQVNLSDLGIEKGVFQKFVTPAQIQELKEWHARAEEFVGEYTSDAKSVSVPLGQNKGELFGAFIEYLRGGYTHLVEFDSFLREKEYVSARESIRPFLASLAEEEQEARKSNNSKSIIQEAVEYWSGWVTSGLHDEVFLPWANSLWAAMVKKEKIDTEDPAVELALFLVNILRSFNKEATADTITEDDVVRVFIHAGDLSSWLPGLRDAYIKFGRAKIGLATSNIQQLLGEYRQRESLPATGVVFENVFSGQKRKREKTAFPQLTSADVDEPAEVEEELYQFGVIVGNGQLSEIQVLTEDQMIELVDRQAEKIARDPRLLADVRTMYSSIQRKPFGPGSEKLPWKTIKADYKELPLRRLSPAERMDVSLSHELSRHLRLVYAVYRRGHAIVIEGLYTHDDYVKKFDMKNL